MALSMKYLVFYFLLLVKTREGKKKKKKFRNWRLPTKPFDVLLLNASSIPILPALSHDVPPLLVRVHSFVPFTVIFCLLLLFSSFAENNPKLTHLVASFTYLLLNF